MDSYKNNDLITTKKSNKVSQDKRCFRNKNIFENRLLLVLQFAGASKNDAISTSGKLLFASMTSKLQNIKIYL